MPSWDEPASHGKSRINRPPLSLRFARPERGNASWGVRNRIDFRARTSWRIANRGDFVTQGLVQRRSDDAPRGCLARRGIIERAQLSNSSDRIRQNVESVRGRIAAA